MYSFTPDHSHFISNSSLRRVFIWGREGDGQLGVGEIEDRVLKPQELATLGEKSIKQIACGGRHCVSLSKNGDVYTWGWNWSGQLGVDGGDRFRPQLVKSLALIRALNGTKIEYVAAGYEYSLALAKDGSLYTWGGNTDGSEEGDINIFARKILSLHPYKIVAISSGGGHNLCLTDTGRVFAWGRSKNGRCGLGKKNVSETIPVSIPREIEHLKCTAIVAGWSHSLAIVISDRENGFVGESPDSGRVYAWGRSNDGVLGIGGNETLPVEDQYSPVEIRWFTENYIQINQIAAGYYHSAALDVDGRLYTWGWGEHGQLGHGDFKNSYFPKRVKFPIIDGKEIRIKQVSCGGYHTVAVTDEGLCFSFGLGLHGQLGIDIDLLYQLSQGLPEIKISSPYPISALEKLTVQNVTCGFWHSIAIIAPQSTSTVPDTEEDNNINTEYPDEIDKEEMEDDQKIFNNEHQYIPPEVLDISSENPDLVKSRSSLKLPDPPEEPKNTGFLEKFATYLANIFFQDNLHQQTILLNRKKLQSRVEQAEVKAYKKQQSKTEKAEDIWKEQILTNWDKFKRHPKTIQLWLEGIPTSVRSTVWLRAVGNSLLITPQIFQECYEKAKIIRKNSTDDYSSFRLIEVDLPRTLASTQLFQKGGPLYDQLMTVLETYAVYRPEIGYVQGMSYLAAVLLLYNDTYSTFLCFANVLNTHFYGSLFKMEIKEILIHLKIYDRLFRYNLPELYKQFINMTISSEQYLLDWFLTMFGKALPINIVSRVWDCYFLQGEIFLYRCALGILLAHRKYLLSADFEQCVSSLRKLAEDMDEGLLFKCIKEIRVPMKEYKLVEKISTKKNLSMPSQESDYFSPISVSYE